MASPQATWSISSCPSNFDTLEWVNLDAMDPASSSQKSEEG